MSKLTELIYNLGGELDAQLNGLTSRMDEISSRVTSLGERVGVDLTAGVPLLRQDERVKVVMRQALEEDSGVVSSVHSVVRTLIEKAVEDGEVAAYEHEHDDQYAEQEHEHDEYASTSSLEDLDSRIEEVENGAPDTEAIDGRLDMIEERIDAAGRKLTE